MRVHRPRGHATCALALGQEAGTRRVGSARAAGARHAGSRDGSARGNALRPAVRPPRAPRASAARAAFASTRRARAHVPPARRRRSRPQSRRCPPRPAGGRRQHGGREHERRRTLELRRLGRPGCLLQARERLRAEDAEAPRVRPVMVRRPARELEQLVDRLRGHGLRTEGLCVRRERISSGKSTRGTLARRPGASVGLV